MYHVLPLVFPMKYALPFVVPLNAKYLVKQKYQKYLSIRFGLYDYSSKLYFCLQRRVSFKKSSATVQRKRTYMRQFKTCLSTRKLHNRIYQKLIK
ncbi:TPA: hypothetical protein DIS60_04485 [Patescibacteria group bacterium]|nr:hypothetical protein [Patescibacteria group bacterium]